MCVMIPLRETQFDSVKGKEINTSIFWAIRFASVSPSALYPFAVTIILSPMSHTLGA